jgi:hypothetical protein
MREVMKLRPLRQWQFATEAEKAETANWELAMECSRPLFQLSSGDVASAKKKRC